MERVRALAGQIVRQAADQDDLVQEAVVRALAKPSAIAGESGPWVRRVVRNLAIDRQRSSARRKDREISTVDREAAHESAADSVARAECQRDLVDHVLKLPEPYRAVILARFFDGLPPREISKKLGVPVATVKKQQERGMALLRKELEGRYGQDGAWAVALLPILPKAVLRSLAAKGAGAGTLAFAPRWIAFAAVVLAGIALPAYLYTGSAGVGPDVAIAPLEPLADSANGGGEPLEERLEVSVDRSAALQPTVEDVRVLTGENAVLRTFTGRFVDVFGEPVAGVTATCRVAEGGAAEQGQPGTPGRGSAAGVVFASLSAPLDLAMVVDVEADGFAPAVYRFRSKAEVEPGAGEPLVDVGRQTLFRPVDLKARVVDAAGVALAGWEMSYFHYGGGERLERGRGITDPITGYATFEGIAAAEVEVIAEHPSGLEIHRPSRPLRAGEAAAVDLVHLGPDPARRVGVTLQWPALAAKSAGSAPLQVTLHDGVQSVATLMVPLGEQEAGFEDVAPGHYFLRVEDPRFQGAEAPAAPGESARLALEGNARLALTLREPDGRVLGDYDVELASGAGRSLVLQRWDAASALEGLVPGQPFVLRARTADGRQAAHEVRALEPNEVRVLDLTLGDGLTSIRVQAVRGDGRLPVVGAEVALFDGAIAAGSKEELRALALLELTPRTGDPKRLALGRTNKQGVATLQVLTHEMGATVTALAADGDHGLARVEQGAARVALSALGSVSVRAEGLPAEFAREGSLPVGVALTLTWPGSATRGRAPHGPGLVLERDGDGAFGTALAPEGPATVWLSLSDFNHTGRGTPLGGVTGPVGYPVGSVDVRAGVASEVTVDLGELWPGRVEVVVRDAGQVLSDAVVELEPVGSHGHLPYPFGADVTVSRTLSQLTDGSGRALFPRVPKGRWKIRIRDIEWLWVSPGGEVEVRSGARERIEVAAELATSEVQILDDATGEPLRSGSVTIEMAPRHSVRRMTDAEGRLQLRLGPGKYPVSITKQEGAAAAPGTLEWDVDGPARPVLRLAR